MRLQVFEIGVSGNDDLGACINCQGKKHVVIWIRTCRFNRMRIKKRDAPRDSDDMPYTTFETEVLVKLRAQDTGLEFLPCAFVLSDGKMVQGKGQDAGRF